MRYKGAVLSATAPTTSSSSAQGVWSMRQQLQAVGGTGWPYGALPPAPTIGTATATSYSSATVSFTAPSGSYGITGYTATSSPGGITGTISGSGSGTITVSGLSASTSYTFTVTATNPIGVSSPSAASNSITTPLAPPTTIGQAYGGGYYAGKINVSGTQYYLVVSPKASGESTAVWGTYGVNTGVTSLINGPTNSATLAGLGSTYAAATFCEGLTIGGYSDWYLPATNELEVCYYFLKPGTNANDTRYGANANAVSPEPVNTNYTTGSPAQTSAGIGFRTGETNAFALDFYWASTQYDLGGLGNGRAWVGNFNYGSQYDNTKGTTNYVRAVRRIPV